MIDDGGVKLAEVLVLSPHVFCTKFSDEGLDGLIIALAAWFNDLKTYYIHAIAADKKAEAYRLKVDRDEHPSREDHLNAMLAGSYYNHAMRLIASHCVELFHAISENREILRQSEFRKAVEGIPAERRKYWLAVEKISLDEELGDAGLVKELGELKKIFIRMRSNGTYHYDSVKHFAKGYKKYFVEKKAENDPFYSLGTSPGATRFFFADRSQEYVLEELESLHSSPVINEFASIAQHAIKDLILSFIQLREI